MFRHSLLSNAPSTIPVDEQLGSIDSQKNMLQHSFFQYSNDCLPRCIGKLCTPVVDCIAQVSSPTFVRGAILHLRHGCNSQTSAREVNPVNASVRTRAAMHAWYANSCGAHRRREVEVDETSFVRCDLRWHHERAESASTAYLGSPSRRSALRWAIFSLSAGFIGICSKNWRAALMLQNG